MSSLIDEYTKNKSPEDKKEVERRVREMSGNMSELSALMLVLEEMRQEGKKRWWYHASWFSRRHRI